MANHDSGEEVAGVFAVYVDDTIIAATSSIRVEVVQAEWPIGDLATTEPNVGGDIDVASLEIT